MFAHRFPRLTASLARAAALVKAFALLEEPPRSAPAAAHPAATNTRAAGHSAYQCEPRGHPHRAALVAPAWDRRPGAPPRPVAPCTMPILRRARDGHGDRVEQRSGAGRAPAWVTPPQR
jgi:hypothetical protein